MANGKFSRRNVVLLIAALICAGALPFLAAFAQSNKQNKKELRAQAEALLAKSQGLSNIEAPGSPPFVLNATIHYQIGAQSMDGQGQIIWLAPDHYREGYNAPGYEYTEVVRDGYRYLARTNDEMPLIIFELHTVVKKAMAGPVDSKENIKKVSATSSGNDATTCITRAPDYMECLDNDADEVVYEKDWPKTISAMNERIEFSDFVTFGNKRFPQKIVFRGGDGDAIEIDVQRLAFIKDAPADAFQIPLHSAQETWCATPKYDRDVSLLRNSSREFFDATVALMQANTSLYCVIGPGGHVRSAYIFHSDGKVKDKDLQTWISMAQFDPLVCGKDSQEYQIKMTLSRP